MCSRDDIVKLLNDARAKKIVPSTEQSSSATESIRIDLVQRIVQMTDEELKFVRPYVMNLNTMDNKRQLTPNVPCETKGAFKSEPVDGNDDISRKSSVERTVKRSTTDDPNCTADISTLSDRKRQCISTASITTAAGPAPILVTPMNSSTKETSIESVKQIKCDVCERDTTDLVDHYVKEHYSLVYDSQISARFRKVMESGMLRTTFFVSTPCGLLYSQYCAFCEKKIDAPRSEWIAHLLKHTGEDEYECRSCNMTFACKRNHEKSQKCDGRKIAQRKMGDVPVVGYLCNSCNYVQIFESNMFKHIEERHFVNNTNDEREKEYTSIQLVCFRHDMSGPLIKNDQPEIFPANPKYTQLCVLCTGIKTVGHVDHYISSHSNAEVYISRISTQMKYLTQNRYQKPLPDDLSFMQALCLFCERNWRMTKSAWSLHLTFHTGEKNLTSKLEENCFDGYICNLCNYVQISEGNLMAHVLNQHGVEVANIYKVCLKINLLHSPSS